MLRFRNLEERVDSQQESYAKIYSGDAECLLPGDGYHRWLLQSVPGDTLAAFRHEYPWRT